MNGIDISKYKRIINKKNTDDENEKKVKNYFINLTFRTMIVVVILLFLAIVYKSDSGFSDIVSNCFFENEISFTKINKLYDKYLGGLLPLKKDNDSSTAVFDEKLEFSAESIYYDGVKLRVSENYLVPSLDEGMVVFIGDKENYGTTVIIENLDGIDFWYGNVSNTSLKLYDYVEKGTLVGDVNNDLYLVFSKNGKYLNYEEYIY